METVTQTEQQHKSLAFCFIWGKSFFTVDTLPGLCPFHLLCEHHLCSCENETLY